MRTGCGGETLLWLYANTNIKGDEFKPLGNLQSAVLDASVEVSDFVSQSSFPAKVSIGWTGLGSIVTLVNRIQTHNPSGCQMIFNERIKFRSANAQGTISFDGQDITFSPSDQIQAQLSQSKGENLQIDCGGS